MKKKAQTKREVIIAAWERRQRPAAGEKELREIQRALAGRFGEGGVASPAAIARVLADEDAELRHPEVIEFDARWREAKIQKGTAPVAKNLVRASENPLTLSRAARLIGKLDRARQRFARKADATNLRRLRDLAIKEKQHAEARAHDSRLNEQARTEQAEIAEWLRVWLQTPDLFADWLDLRKRSPEFQQKFSTPRSEERRQA
jgi:hypothetical protein